MDPFQLKTLLLKSTCIWALNARSPSMYTYDWTNSTSHVQRFLSPAIQKANFGVGSPMTSNRCSTCTELIEVHWLFVPYIRVQTTLIYLPPRRISLQEIKYNSASHKRKQTVNSKIAKQRPRDRGPTHDQRQGGKSHTILNSKLKVEMKFHFFCFKRKNK